MITNIHETYKMSVEYQERLEARAREALLRALPFVETPEHREDVVTFLITGNCRAWSTESMRGLGFDRHVARVMLDMKYYAPHAKYLAEFESSIRTLESLIINDPRNS